MAFPSLKRRRFRTGLFLAAAAVLVCGGALIVFRLKSPHTPPGTLPESAGDATLLAEVRRSPRAPAPRVRLVRSLISQHRPWDALDAARQAQQALPRDAAVTLATAEALSATGSNAEAVELLRPFAARGGEYQIALASYLTAEGERGEAMHALPSVFPNNPDLAFQAAQVYGNALDTRSAIPLLEQALAAHPGSEAIAAYLGSALLTEGRYPEAARVLRDALERSPDRPVFRFYLGVALRLAADERSLADAEDQLRRVLKAQPANNLALYELARVQLDWGNRPGALISLRLITRQPAPLPEAWRDLGQALQESGNGEEAAPAWAHYREALQDAPRAVRELEPWFRKQPASLDLGLALAEAYSAAQAPARAAALLRSLRPGHPESTDLLWSLFRATRDLQKNHEAEQLLELLKKAGADPTRVLEERADLWNGQRRTAEAEKAFTALRDREPENAYRYYQLGLYYVLISPRADKNERAEENLRRALSLSPGFVGPHYRLGLLLQSAGKLPEAIAELRAAANLSPEFAETLMALGRAYTQAGDRAHAEEFFRVGRRLQDRDAEQHRLELVLRQPHSTRAARWDLARFDLRSNRLEPATRELESLAYFYPEDREAHRLLSRLYGYARRFQRAAEEAKLAGAGR